MLLIYLTLSIIWGYMLLKINPLKLILFIFTHKNRPMPQLDFFIFNNIVISTIIVFNILVFVLWNSTIIKLFQALKTRRLLLLELTTLKVTTEKFDNETNGQAINNINTVIKNYTKISKNDECT